MFVNNIYDFFKKINFRRFLPVLACSLLFVALSPVQAFAFDSQSSDVLPYSWILHNTDYAFELTVEYLDDSNVVTKYKTWDYLSAEQISNNSTLYSFHDLPTNNIRNLMILNRDARFDFEYIPEFYDYYLYCIFTNGNVTNANQFSFMPNGFQIVYGRPGLGEVYFSDSYNEFYKVQTHDTAGFSCLLKLPPPRPDNSSYIGSSLYYPVGFSVYSSGGVTGTIPSDLYFEGLVIAFPKSSGFSSDDIVSAINNQTSVLNNSLSSIQSSINNNFNNFMSSGSQFGSTISGILSGNDELSGYIDDYTQIEQTMHNNFESAQSALIGDFTGFSWGSLANTLSWTSDYMQQIYLNSGDFKMMIILPLLLGIALFFIGRGAIILSNSNKDN